MMKNWGQIYAHYEVEEPKPEDIDINQVEQVVRDFLVKLGKRLGRVKQGGIVD